MATYKGIQGYTVQSLSADPTVEESIGQLWYRNDTGKFKISTEGAGTWSAGGNYPVGTTAHMGSAGIQTAAISFMGLTTAAYVDESYSYDGSSWATGVTMNREIGAYAQGCGTQTACVAGGYYRGPSPTGVKTTAEEYNGTGWTTINSCGDAKGARTGCGTATAALEAGGFDVSPGSAGFTTAVEEFDGTNWSEGTAMNTARAICGNHNGTQTASLTISGSTPSVVANVEEWNGSSWTEIVDVNTARKMGGASGTVSLALFYGGAPPPNGNASTESWNGTSWTEVADLTTNQHGGGGSAGTDNTSALCISGGQNSYDPECEEWNSPVYSIDTVTVS